LTNAIGLKTTLSGVQSNNNNNWTGTNSFNTSLPTSTQTPSTSTQLITKSYGDSTYAITNEDNTFTGNNSFTNLTVNTNLLAWLDGLNYSTVTPLQLSYLSTLSENVQTALTNTSRLTDTQTISGTKTFSNLPICSDTVTSNNQLTNKTYVDSACNAVLNAPIF
jgi:hypothetical protein